MSNNPYYLLQTNKDASDDEIKKAYLKYIRRYPPEVAAEQFKEGREAYEKIRTQRDRIKHEIFDMTALPIEALFADLLNTNSTTRPRKATLIQALTLGLKGKL